MSDYKLEEPLAVKYCEGCKRYGVVFSTTGARFTQEDYLEHGLENRDTFHHAFEGLEEHERWVYDNWVEAVGSKTREQKISSRANQLKSKITAIDKDEKSRIFATLENDFSVTFNVNKMNTLGAVIDNFKILISKKPTTDFKRALIAMRTTTNMYKNVMTSSREKKLFDATMNKIIVTLDTLAAHTKDNELKVVYEAGSTDFKTYKYDPPSEETITPDIFNFNENLS